MRRVFCAVFSIVLFSLPGHAKTKVAIPEARFRVLYKDTGKPVEWAAVSIDCFREYGWFHADEEKVYGTFFYTEAPDGWITIPRVEESLAPGTNDYEIKVWVPGCTPIDNPDTAGDRVSRPFNGKTLPRFLKKPLAERVFYTTPKYVNGGEGREYARACDYAGYRYAIAQQAIDLSQWPKLSACYAGGYFEDPRVLQERREKEGPDFKKCYCQEISQLLFYWREGMKHFTKGAEKHKWPSEQIGATVRELEGLARDLICSDIQKKKEQWGGLALAEDIFNDPLIKSCEALKDVRAVSGGCENVPP